MTTTSYSQSSTYINCPQHWQYKYVDRWESIEQSANLHFGTAIDSAVSAILKGEGNYLDLFNKKWFSTVNRKGEVVPIFNSTIITYSNNDFDEFILDPVDLDTLNEWSKEFKLGDNGLQAFEKIQERKNNPYLEIRDSQSKFYNRCCWLSLKKKGEILLKLFEKDFMPKVDQVLAVQKYVHIKDPNTKDAIIGYIDFVAKMKGRAKATIFDLKTAANPYREDQIKHSDQLTLYASMNGKEFDTDEVGYVVLVKNIKKDKKGVCKTCGSEKTSTHRTCNKITIEPGPEGKKSKKVRCGGEWDYEVVLEPELQIMYSTKTEKQMNDILLDQGNILEAMNTNIVYKNTSKCMNWYGNKCPFYDLCHNGEPKGLKKKGS